MERESTISGSTGLPLSGASRRPVRASRRPLLVDVHGLVGPSWGQLSAVWVRHGVFFGACRDAHGSVLEQSLDARGIVPSLVNFSLRAERHGGGLRFSGSAVRRRSDGAASNVRAPNPTVTPSGVVRQGGTVGLRGRTR
eukprot:9105770-Pyramimonas_sp.AAC.1